MKEAKAFWNIRSRIYDDQIGPKYEEAYRRTAECSLRYLKPTDRVLEFACGTGVMTFRLAPHVESIRAIDISDEMVAHAKAKLSEETKNVTIEQLDIFDPGLEEGSFDTVAAYNVLLYLPDRERVLAQIRSLLKPGGMFLSASDCLGEKLTREGLRKFWRSHTGKMPYVAFDSIKGLERTVRAAGFAVLETENLFPAPPNLFIAARKEE